MIEIGDKIKCIKNGGNNTSVGKFKHVLKGPEIFIVKQIHEGERYKGYIIGAPNTIETECGKFLWNNETYFKIVEKGTPINPNYEIY